VHLKMMTLAPELPGAGEVIAACVRDGVVAAAGHTDASYEQAVAGFSRGVRHVTHLYNAMRPFHHRDPGVVGAALSLPGITAEIILDGHHVHRAAFEIAFRVLGPQSLALVSDALPLTGAQSACGAWAGRSLARSGTRVTLDSGALAGGGCALCKAVARAVSWGADPPAAAEMASLAPAAVLGLASRKGRVLPGYDADLVVIDQRWNVLLTLIGGLQAWPAPARAPL
jgi:N-acetylglucosamine-6-phosphate deacetylase